MKKKRCIIGVLCLLCAAALAVLLVWNKKPAQQPPAFPTAEAVNSYRVTMKLDAQGHTLSVTEEIDFKNRTSQTLEEIQLRLWANAYGNVETSPAAADELYDLCYPNGFSPGYVTLHNVEWNESPTEYRFADEAKTVLSVPVGALAPGESGRLYLRCVVQLANCAHRTGYVEETFLLGHVMPTLSIFENGAWRQDAYACVGDPFYTECADYTLTLYLPEGYVPACSVPLTQEKQNVWQGSGRAMRDVGLCVSRGYEMAAGNVGGIRVLGYAGDGKSAAQAVVYAAKALETYQSLYGPYPWPAFTVAEAAFAPGAMEYTGMAVVDRGYFSKDRWDTLELFIAHETAHQWFYALVGSDQPCQPWQDEALCEYALLRYVEKRYGKGSFENLKYFRVDSPMRERISGGLTPGSPIDYFASLSDYKSVVYGRGAALMLALDQFLPDGVDAFLHSYVEQYAFRVASRADFEQALNAFSGQDLSPLVTDYLDTKMME